MSRKHQAWSYSGRLMAYEKMKTEKFPEGFTDEQKEMMHALRFDSALCNISNNDKIQVLMAMIRELKK